MIKFILITALKIMIIMIIGNIISIKFETNIIFGYIFSYLLISFTYNLIYYNE